MDVRVQYITPYTHVDECREYMKRRSFPCARIVLTDFVWEFFTVLHDEMEMHKRSDSRTRQRRQRWRKGRFLAQQQSYSLLPIFGTHCPLIGCRVRRCSRVFRNLPARPCSEFFGDVFEFSTFRSDFLEYYDRVLVEMPGARVGTKRFHSASDCFASGRANWGDYKNPAQPQSTRGQ